MTLSVVTACMNRNDHLARTIRQWLARDWVAEVVVVDWSSAMPVARTLRDVPQDKIRVIRAEGEEHWALTYAYNLGISHAAGDTILKVDADCFVDDRLSATCRPGDTHFYAGHSYLGAPAGAHRSCQGQCFLGRDAFERVNGFNEFIRTYGFDDDDLYQRLQGRGLTRLDIDHNLLAFIDHSTEARIAKSPRSSNGRPAQVYLESKLGFQGQRNRIIAEQLPWGRWFPRAGYRTLARDGAVTTVERARELEMPLPKAVADFADLQAGRVILDHLQIDTGGAAIADYRSVIDCFETWAVRQLAQADKDGVTQGA